ncbi:MULTISPECIES: hypothetical protein [Actinosynnema]|uniref:hypothetical protein n=1 Tax=Actinosynnema TaxID=40566 RepID=UPI0020A43EA4|nr:hypothetical protein [Actinosynnema pretiosum]MCP2097369.1 hypothetical protein [Actinosynnema pretiosum]
MDENKRGRWLSAIGKHIARYQQDGQATYVHASLRTSQEIDLLLRLRRQDRVPGNRVEQLARDCGLPRPEWRDVLAAQEEAGLLDASVREDGGIDSVVERIFTEQAVYEYAARRFEQRYPEPAERALVPLMDLLSRLPLDDGQIIDRLTPMGFAEAEVVEVIALAVSFGLARRRDVPEFGVSLLYNEYLYSHKLDAVQQTLAGLGDRDTNSMLALMEEVGQEQGLPLERLTAAPPHLVKMAATIGLLDAISVHTSTGQSKAFAFSPQFHGLNLGQANPELAGISDQVKLMVASMQYGVRYSDWNLYSPAAFLTKLINTGEAGGNGVTPIGRDYVLVEKYGILKTERTYGDRYRFKLVKKDIVVAARDALEKGWMGGGASGGVRQIEQKSYRSPEAVRLKLAETPNYNPLYENQYLAAIRQRTSSGLWVA